MPKRPAKKSKTDSSNSSSTSSTTNAPIILKKFRLHNIPKFSNRILQFLSLQDLIKFDNSFEGTPNIRKCWWFPQLKKYKVNNKAGVEVRSKEDISFMKKYGIRSNHLKISCTLDTPSFRNLIVFAGEGLRSLELFDCDNIVKLRNFTIAITPYLSGL